ncbi:DNA-directed RNA polymerase subunit E'' [Candidatus Pacearchaeota archaeon]|nr:DNA-directed RNA polymerase subunit E'' [Candidatus Pacearchaeota archaeon]
MAVKACKSCKYIVEGSTCPACGGKEFSDGFKGRVAIVQPDQSEVAKQLKFEKKGVFALKL